MPQIHEIKILNSKHFDKQLELTISCIKSKLFEITNKFKELKFQQNLKVEFTKREKFLKK